MSINYRKLLQGIIFFMGVMCVTCFVLTRLFPKAPARWQTAAAVKTTDTKEVIRFTALGDSLTEGVGDLTNRGGFVGLLTDDLKEAYGLNAVAADNYGVSGNRSDQIIKRVKKQEEIRESLAQADFITITVGGNDLMKVFQSNFFNLSIEKFDKPMKEYQERLMELFGLIRAENPTAPIYVLGIYNPYYLNFPEITDLQTIFDNWNDATAATVAETEACYFIPINDLLYQGLEGSVGIEGDETGSEGSDASDASLNSVINDALYDGDNFHPNNLGYQLMANAVKEQLAATENQWLPKGEE